MRIARFVLDQSMGMNGHTNGNGYHAPVESQEPMDEPAQPPRATPIYDPGTEPSSPE
jgi:hypothetical protein